MKNKNAILGLSTFVYYYLFSMLSTLPIYLIGVNYSDLDINIKIIYLIIVEILFIISLFYINKDLITQFKEFIKNFKTLIKEYFKYWPMAFGLMIIANLTLLLIMPDNTANNQEAINKMMTTVPVYIIISAVIFAPIVEEIVFRLAFRKIFKNDTIFILLSGIIFGAFHVVGSLDSLMDLLFIIPYSIPGLVFAYTLVKSKNVYVPMTLHFFHNGFTMLLQVILLSFL